MEGIRWGYRRRFIVVSRHDGSRPEWSLSFVSGFLGLLLPALMLVEAE